MCTPASCAVATFYFSAVADDHRGKVVASDKFSFIEPWWSSMRRQRLRGLVFHNALSAAFISNYTTAQVEFVRVDLSHYPRQSLNDARFAVMLAHLRANPRLQRVWMTDARDVWVMADPLAPLVDGRIYAGHNLEPILTPGTPAVRNARMKDAPEWCRPLLRRNRDAPYLNAGLLGGQRTPFLRFLERVVDTLAEQPPHSNRNMLVVNCVLLADWQGRFATSPAAPVHRECGQLANASERARPVWFVHKCLLPEDAARGVPFRLPHGGLASNFRSYLRGNVARGGFKSFGAAGTRESRHEIRAKLRALRRSNTPDVVGLQN